MTIALKIGDEKSQVKGFIYLDAVTSYTKTLAGKVTSFPLDSGVSISDHFIAENSKFTLEGIVSNVDISGESDLVSIDNEKPMNAKARPDSPTIYAQESTLQYLPSSVKQFFDRSDAGILVETETQTALPAIEALFEELMRGNYYNSADNKWKNKMTLTTLYEMDGSNFVNAKTDLVITNVSVTENADSGDAMSVSITLEKVRFVTLDKTEMPKNANVGVKKKIAATENKGKVDTVSGKLGESDLSKEAPKMQPAGTFKDAYEVSKNHLASRR